MANSGHSLFLQLWLHTDRIIETILYLKPVMKTKFFASWIEYLDYILDGLEVNSGPFTNTGWSIKKATKYLAIKPLKMWFWCNQKVHSIQKYGTFCYLCHLPNYLADNIHFKVPKKM